VVNPGDVLDGVNNADVRVPGGYQAGIAGVQGSSNNVRLNATEYGLVISLMSVVPRTAYAGGIDRFWTKYNDRTEFYNPYFQGIGDQEVYDIEKGYQLDAANYGTWGYQTRWAEYKYKLSTAQNEFAEVGNLDDFHMATVHDITGAPETLSAAGATVQYNDDEYIRIFQSQGAEHHLYYTVYNDAQFVRPMYLTDIPQ